MSSQHISFCRICTGGCGVIVELDEQQRLVSLRGNPDSPLSKGYACFKGLQAPASHNGPERRLHPLRRTADGRQLRIGSDQAMAEITERLRAIIAQHGPESVAIFSGNGSLFNVSSYIMQRSFLSAIGSDQFFSTVTIDQSAKAVSFGRLGGWAAGIPAFEDMEVAMLIGANPLVSHGSLGFLQVDPVKRLKAARAKGLKLIIIDPRRSETARNADIFLQPYPGEDPAIIGGLIRLILAEGWEDKEFCAAYVGADRIADLRAAVEPLTEDDVEQRAGLEPGQLRAVAELFARDSNKGCVQIATGPCMAPYSNLAQHLADTLNVICGRFLRAGDRVHRIDAASSPGPVHAEVIPALRGWEAAGESRIRGTHSLYGERPSATLTDEILTPGKGRIRALIVDGGDPLTSLPDQRRTAQAMEALDLLVCIDPWPSPTTQYADYVLPTLMQYERADLPMTLAGYACWPGGWTQYTPPIARPPEGSDVVEEWRVFWEIARQLGKQITYNGTTPIDMETAPTTDQLLDIVIQAAPVTIDDLKAHPEGIDLAPAAQFVLPARPEAKACFDPMPSDVAAEMEVFLGMPSSVARLTPDEGYTHLMMTRRMRDLFNSHGRFVSTVRKRTPYNPAFLHPDDLERIGLSEGDRVELFSRHGRVVAIVSGDPDLKPGIVSIAHGWGALPGSNEDPSVTGTAVNALIDTDQNFEAINAMPHMSAVPVGILPLR
jgi:anaerobic selenocysteine-containing dehydrogenase